MRGAIEDGLNIMYNTDIPAYDANTPAVQLFSDGRINYEQVILVRNYSLLLEKTEEDILRSIGLLRRLQVPHKEMADICNCENLA